MDGQIVARQIVDRDTWTDRQTGRQTDRQADRQTDRERGRDRGRDRVRDRDGDGNGDREERQTQSLNSLSAAMHHNNSPLLQISYF